MGAVFWLNTTFPDGGGRPLARIPNDDGVEHGTAKMPYFPQTKVDFKSSENPTLTEGTYISNNVLSIGTLITPNSVKCLVFIKY